MSKKINFDEYASNYTAITQKKLNFFNNSRDYFDVYKVKITKKIFFKPARILDYGCGIGLCVKYLKIEFPDSEIYGTDLSKESLKIAKSKNPFLNIVDIDNLTNYKFDLIFVAGVFHHIEPKNRHDVFSTLNNLLDNNGGLIIFEHNPFNFITKKLVSECPYDEGVELIKMSNLQSLFNFNDLNIVDKGYTLFFPSFLSFLRKFEIYLKSFFLGGQYYIAGKKKYDF